jgi:putative FmdB family regulatory protein
MPLYEYECESCGERFEKIQKFSDAPIDVCAKCAKGPVRKLPSSPAIQFKGSGWYITDYARKSSTAAGKESKESKESSKDKKEPASSTTETKPAATDKKD